MTDMTGLRDTFGKVGDVCEEEYCGDKFRVAPREVYALWRRLSDEHMGLFPNLPDDLTSTEPEVVLATYRAIEWALMYCLGGSEGDGWSPWRRIHHFIDYARRLAPNTAVGAVKTRGPGGPE